MDLFILLYGLRGFGQRSYKDVKEALHKYVKEALRFLCGGFTKETAKGVSGKEKEGICGVFVGFVGFVGLKNIEENHKNIEEK